MIKSIAKGINLLFGGILKKNKVFVSNSLEFLHRERTLDKNYFDYVRLSMQELISFEINNKKLQGNVAELGVYKGKFARYINQYFSDRSVEAVLKQMPFPNQCKPHIGFFPESAKDVQGGYIFVHDFNNNNYKGARKAV